MSHGHWSFHMSLGTIAAEAWNESGKEVSQSKEERDAERSNTDSA
jgi:hypothetical protein